MVVMFLARRLLNLFYRTIVWKHSICLILCMAMTEITTIRGIVIPVAWNEKGDVISVAIATYNEGKYLVEDNIKNRQLLSLLRKRVVVNGVLAKHDTIKVIEIDDFRQDTSKV